MSRNCDRNELHTSARPESASAATVTPYPPLPQTWSPTWKHNRRGVPYPPRLRQTLALHQLERESGLSQAWAEVRTAATAARDTTDRPTDTKPILRKLYLPQNRSVCRSSATRTPSILTLTPRSGSVKRIPTNPVSSAPGGAE